MEKILLVIDSYISNLERASYCEKLIKQLRSVFDNYKILLINKSRNNFGLENIVDYYFNMGDSFMVSAPPKELIDSSVYSVPYVYVQTSLGTFENWMPLTGVTDHVAGIYNSFVISAKFAESLGFEKVFKFEFDTEFDYEELSNIKTEIEDFEDYILYGVRHQGQWETNNLVDVHIIGYSTKIFKGFDIVRNDDEYWDLCKKVGYYTKWIEYIVPVIIDYQKQNYELNGTIKYGHLEDYYPKTKFDVVNSPGMWTEKWKTIPMVGRISLDDGKTELDNKVSVFYYNSDFEFVDVKCQIFSDDNLVHNMERNLPNRHWTYDEIEVTDEIKVFSEYVASDGTTYKNEKIIKKGDIPFLNQRMVKL